MGIIISESLFQSLLDYLYIQSTADDTKASELLEQLQDCYNPNNKSRQSSTAEITSLDLSPEFITQFGRDLFEAWRELAISEVGDNFWSYPIRIFEMADEMNLAPEVLVQYLAVTKLDNLQLIQNRGSNFAIGNQKAASLTFHPTENTLIAAGLASPNLSLPKSTAIASESSNLDFKVGDQVRVNANRPQYANQTGTVEQIISVSCRVKLDNGWSAFLPKTCLEKLA